MVQAWEPLQKWQNYGDGEEISRNYPKLIRKNMVKISDLVPVTHAKMSVYNTIREEEKNWAEEILE